MSVFRCLMLSLLGVVLGVAAPAQAQSIEPGEWEGSMTLPNRAMIPFSVVISVNDDGSQTATITIPEQGVFEQALDEVTFDDNSISFAWNDIGAAFEGRLGANRKAIVGTVQQRGLTYPFKLTRPEPRPAFDDFIPREEQRWRGVAKLPGLDLKFMVTFTPVPADTGWTGVVDIPIQNIEALPLRDVRFDDEVHFTIQLDAASAPPPAVFRLRRTGAETASGTFTQAGSQFLVELSQITDPNERVELDRPQTPQPPFPYAAREVKYQSDVDGVTIAGTLTIPEGDGPHPAVLMITGSGAQDRDETLMGHKPFFVIADHLTRRGIAVLRVDDRGVGESGGDIMETTAETNVRDIITGVDFLAEQPEIDSSRIGLIGHSEGGWLAPIAASRDDDIAFMALLAAPGVSGRELMLMQRDLVRKTVGVPPTQRQKESEAHAALMDAVVQGLSEEEIAEALRKLARLERVGAPDVEEYADQIVEQQLAMMQSVWFRDVIDLDSRAALRQVRIPVLAITGEIDLQVPPEENMREIRGALDAAGNTQVELVTMPGLNHLLQTANRGLPSEYLAISETISPDVLDLLTTWLQEQAGIEGESSAMD